jgi:hypothetical protein
MFSKALDEGKEIRVIFFDISKAFDRVWHRGLLFKLKKLGIVGNLVFILFFVDRGDVCQFPFIWNMFSYQTNVKNSTQWFRNNIVSHF